MRQFGAVWALIEEMRRENSQLITSEVFVVLMRRFASAKMVKKAVGGLGRRLGHFTSLLYGWCKEGKLMEAKFVLVQLREAGFKPDIVVYNSLLGGYTAVGKMADAFDLLEDMRRKRCEPSATSFTILIQALCGKDRTEEAMRVLLDMERSGCEADVVVYTALISGFCKWGKVDRGYEVLDGLIQKGHTPNQTTYLHIMLAHEKKEDLEECVELVGEMRKIGCIPDLNIYNVLVRLTCKLGESKDVWWKLVTTFKEMVGRGHLSAPQYGTLKELLNSLLRADKLELCKDVWSCIITKGCELNVYAWTIWIHALFSNGHAKEACSYCLDMMDAGVMPQPDTFAKLMRALRKLYNRQIAAEITEKVRTMAAERQMTFKMYKRRGERDLNEKFKAKRREGRERLVDASGAVVIVQLTLCNRVRGFTD
ncbi:hypothetical protein RJ639_045218 [Escallonia herrerae]|uniref:Pentatricopeptide repeat-containing protein n=1 Tax=Escallonia herrerae TaxID=1293975 RepID=A0AA88W8I6_9ASTE|nr:hypothetical protein RJ639_045218 [Escallonia herrerae]